MNIQVKQLGVISEGEIDLSKKLSVFCGPNGTGKTYMAYVLYALTRLNNKEIGIKLPEELQVAALSEQVFEIEISAPHLFAFRQNEIQKVKNNLWSLFSIAQENAAAFFKNTTIESTESESEFIEKFEALSIDEEFQMYNYTFHITKKVCKSTVTVKLGEKIVKDEQFQNFLNIAFLSRLYSFLSFYPITSSKIFPVERNSIYTFVKELSIKRNEALEHLEAIASKKDVSYLDMFFKRSSRYPQPIRDGLAVAEDLENIQKNTSLYFNFAEEIEHKLLNGRVIITKEGSVEFASNKAPKTKLSFHQSSSIVKTLASLVIYLKHEAQRNDLIIIDEPELNLHPETQVMLARIFAKMINTNLRMIVSTHSDYIVREFNNLLMIASEKPEIKQYAKNKGYEKDEILFPSDVSAYMFNFKSKSAKQCIVTKLPINENGFEVPSVDQTIDDQNEIAEELSYLVKYAKEKK